MVPAIARVLDLIFEPSAILPGTTLTHLMRPSPQGDVGPLPQKKSCLEIVVQLKENIFFSLLKYDIPC
jgi:hypothetical protein